MITWCGGPWFRQASIKVKYIPVTVLTSTANIALILKVAHFLLSKAHSPHLTPFSKSSFRQNTYSKSLSSSTSNTSSHCLLVSTVSDEKSAPNLIEDFFVWWVIFLLLLSRFSLSVFGFESLTMMSSGVDLFMFILLGVCWAPYM